MSNALFNKAMKETDPMFDCAVITPENGIEFWRSGLGNNANNGHSSTKFIFTTAIGILSDRGLIDIHAPVTSFFSPSLLPECYDRGWDKVTVYDTMRHKTGIEDIPFGVDEDDDIEKIGNDFLKYVFSLKIMHEPDTFRKYSDAAYYLLSRIIGSVTGSPADVFIDKNILKPLGFKQWAMAKCPQGHPIGGGGFFARSDDLAKVGYVYAMGGLYNGERIISEKWTDMAMNLDFACTCHAGTDVYVKTGAKGQMVAFTKERKAAAAWHGYSENDGNERNNRLLEGFLQYLDEREKLPKGE